MMILWDHFAGFISKHELKIETRGASIYKTTLRDVFFLSPESIKHAKEQSLDFYWKTKNFCAILLITFFCIRLFIVMLSQCLKIAQKVAFNIASEASYVYILSGQKLIKRPKIVHFGEFLKT